MATYEEIKAKGKLPQTSIPVCLRGDLASAYEEMDREHKLLKAEARRGGTLAGSSAELQAIEEKLASLREEMRGDTMDFVLRGLSRKKFSDLKAAHRPRDEDKEAGVDYNGETFPVALVQACLIDPSLTIPELEDLVDTIFTQGQWDTLFWGAMLLNRGTVDIPT